MTSFLPFINVIHSEVKTVAPWGAGVGLASVFQEGALFEKPAQTEILLLVLMAGGQGCQFLKLRRDSSRWFERDA